MICLWWHADYSILAAFQQIICFADLSQVVSTSINRVTQFTQSDSEGSAHLECDHSVDRTACFCNNNGKSDKSCVSCYFNAYK